MKAKILVVDDEADLEVLIKQKFRRQIREGKYEFLFAENGITALQKLQENADIDIVLSDINMPEMDGLTLLVKLNEANPLVKAVIVSAYGDMENIRVAMNRGAFDFLCKPVDFEDLEVTMQKTLRHVEQLRQTLKAIKENDILRMYVDETVLQFMTRSEFESSLTANETIEGSVVFVDICGFTAITEREPADVVVQMINSYFDVIVKAIIAQGGYVDKFIGDAVMAVFRGEFHLDRAIEASLAVRTQLSDIEESLPDQTFLPQVAIGINSGEMVSGNIGSASLRRLDYTVIGDTVNLAQRLQSAAKPGQILITDDVYQRVKESFQGKILGEVTLKNKSLPVQIVEVIA
ncbi:MULTISPECIES: adenylate/guanylate cyclase domain-containing protein [unclassified Siphonobacter]|uniref:adenylate/guanylate cyclase domain-containing protein n=1 Tax=unclassified Siphonobacter TaxID=2635712 RepID=UPI00278B8911|nr:MULTISPECIES: adenylate/guanylate cyclase domain-containing protein [unclassified Siphonobacter]MDQ1090117.1 adenylate cyclase [Siphonobacter sp. SORGH_AS_1065]MDR6197539.1 adenylate cyclase [Siphonobacter sp. SORGH_AS_0500]